MYLAMSQEPTKEDIDALKNTMIGKIATEMITDAGGSEAMLKKLKTGNGFARLFGDIGTKLEAKMRNGTIDENTLFHEAKDLSTTLPSMVPAEDLQKVANFATSNVDIPAETNPTATNKKKPLDASMAKLTNWINDFMSTKK